MKHQVMLIEINKCFHCVVQFIGKSVKSSNNETDKLLCPDMES